VTGAYRAIGLCASLLCGCTDTFLDVIPREMPLGVGLEGRYDVWLARCDPGAVYPDGCQYDEVFVSTVRSRGAAGVTASDSHAFSAAGRRRGEGSFFVEASGRSAEFEVEVVPVVYSMLSWFDGRYRTGAFYDSEIAVEELGPVFLTSVIELWQEHYRVPREELARRSFLDRGEVRVHGDAAFELDAGDTGAHLVRLPAGERPYVENPRTGLKTGTTRGRAELRTRVGGKLVVDIVDHTAVHNLTTYEAFTTGVPVPPLDPYSWQLDALGIVPLDRDGRPIAGCPTDGPTVFDTAGLLQVSRLDVTSTSFCELRFELSTEKEWQDTEIVVQWNAAELRIPLVADPWAVQSKISPLHHHKLDQLPSM
jgi:hypothetical protein